MSVNDPNVLDRLQRARQKKEKKPPTPIASVSEKKKKVLAEEKKLFAADKDFYAEVWAASPHICQECLTKLGREPLTLFFHHLLEKRNHPEFRHTHENVMILCPDCHTQAESDIDKTPKVRERRNEVIKLLLNK